VTTPKDFDPAALLSLPGNPLANVTALNRMLALPVSQWESYLAANPHALDWTGVRRLLDRAQEIVGGDPAKAATITGLLARRVDRYPLAASTDVSADSLRARVWRQHSDALSAADDLPGALAAAERAVAAASAGKRISPIERATTRQHLAMILHGMNRSREALNLLRPDRTVYEEQGAGPVLLAYLLAVAGMELALRDLPATRVTLTRALDVAIAAGDKENERIVRETLAICEEEPAPRRRSTWRTRRR
jgi:hypothetical protein